MSARTYRGQKAGLTRAVGRLNAAERAKRDARGRDGETHDAAVRRAAEGVRVECKRTVDEWSEWRAWPDDWHRWNIALGDAYWAGLNAGALHPCPSHLDDLR